MSTRSVIARKTETGFSGRYHHSDGYPTALGKTLLGLYRRHFERDLTEMLNVLIDDSPAGWSTINADWTLPIHVHGPAERGYEGPKIFEDLGEDAWEINQATAEEANACFVYVFDEAEHRMAVYALAGVRTAMNLGGIKAIVMGGSGWYEVAAFDLNGTGPDFEAIEKCAHEGITLEEATDCERMAN